MIRLVLVTCVALGTGLAKPPSPLQDGDNPSPVPFGDVSPVPFQDEPQPLPVDDTRRIYTLAPGNYYTVSRNYPNNYINNDDYGFAVRGQDGQTLSMTCSPFALEYHYRCAYDYLSINERRYCGRTVRPAVRSTEIRLIFHSDYSVTASGYRCDLTVPAPGATTTTAAPPSGGCRCGRRQNGRVVGGTDATAGQFPWQAGLVSPGGTRTFCGGSVINSRYVLTAAHCTAGSSASQVQVLLGDLRISQSDAGEQRFSVAQIITHPQYTSATGSGNDFSLLKLSGTITFSNTISPVCLAEAGRTYAGVTAIASGYGRVGANLPQATTLQHVQVNVWSQSSCARVWGSTLKDNMICAGGLPEGGKSVCMGDSGGPLVTEVSGAFRLIGVVSFGRPCAVANIPDVYARVTSALSWIASSTADAETCTPRGSG